MTQRFMADVHLGKLARMLRMLGFDTGYSNRASKPALQADATCNGRVLLTRDVRLAACGTLTSLRLSNVNTEEQLRQVIRTYNLMNDVLPFTRCMMCNSPLQPVSKEVVAERLKPETVRSFDEFRQCCDCRRVYWKGLHYARMMKLVEALRA